MNTVTLEHAKEHLAELIEQAANGQPFIITEEGKPSITVSGERTEPDEYPWDAEIPPSRRRRLGWLEGKGYVVPQAFSREGDDEIIRMFEGSDDLSA